MAFRRVDPDRDQDRLRHFLGMAEPGDYLLEDLGAWVREGRHWAALEQGEWIAFGRLHDLGAGQGWLSGFRVLPSLRGQGIGTRLLEVMLADARTLGISELRGVIEDENRASRALFGRFGFRSVTPLTVRCGHARGGGENPWHRARANESLDGPVGWLPESVDRVDLLPGSDGGRFGKWDPSMVARWSAEGKLYLGRHLAAAVQPDWWKNPHTLWVNPLRGTPRALFPALGRLTEVLGHEEWQAFLPRSEELDAQYNRLGLFLHPAWGERVHLHERVESPV